MSSLLTDKASDWPGFVTLPKNQAGLDTRWSSALVTTTLGACDRQAQPTLRRSSQAISPAAELPINGERATRAMLPRRRTLDRLRTRAFGMPNNSSSGRGLGSKTRCFPLANRRSSTNTLGLGLSRTR